MKKASMADVARAAKVSLATVDRVLNGRGGVSPAKEAAILGAARRLELDRALTRRHTRAMRVAVLMQGPQNPFHAALKAGIDLAALIHAELNLTFLAHHVDPNRPERIAALVRTVAPGADGIIATLPDTPAIAVALGEASARIPVVTLADDVPGSGRHAFVGPDDRRAGRVAGDLMGRLLGERGGRVIMLTGLAALRGHREREAGFRDVLARYHGAVEVAAVMESREVGERAGLLVLEAFRADPSLRGIYHSSVGPRPVVDALASLGRADDTAFIVHELTPDRRELLRARRIDAVIDQDSAREALLAVEAMAHLLGRLDHAPATTLTDIVIHMPENA